MASVAAGRKSMIREVIRAFRRSINDQGDGFAGGTGDPFERDSHRERDPVLYRWRAAYSGRRSKDGIGHGDKPVLSDPGNVAQAWAALCAAIRPPVISGCRTLNAPVPMS